MPNRAEALAQALEELLILSDRGLHSAQALENARAALEAWRAQPEGWRPISEDEQFKSGERAWLFQGGEVFSGYYCVIPYSESRDLDGRYIDQTDGEEFWMSDDGDIKEPTHIRPMLAPAPPSQTVPAHELASWRFGPLPSAPDQPPGEAA